MINIRPNFFETNSSNTNAFTYHDFKGEVTWAVAKMELIIENVSIPDDQFDSVKDSLKWSALRDFMDIDKITKEKNKLYIEGEKELYTYYMKFKLPTLQDIDGWDNPIPKHSESEIENSLDHSKQVKLSDELLDSIRSKINKEYCTNSILKVKLRYHVSGEYKFVDGWVEDECIASWDDPARMKGSRSTHSVDDYEYEFDLDTKIIEKEIDINMSKHEQSINTEASLESQHTITDKDFDLNYGESITCNYTLNGINVTYTITRRTPTSRQRSIWERGGYKYYNINASIENNTNLKTGYIAEIHRVPKYNKWKSGNISSSVNVSISKIFFDIVTEHFKNNLMVSDKM